MKELLVPVNDFNDLPIGKLEWARGDQFQWTEPAYKLPAGATPAQK